MRSSARKLCFWLAWPALFVYFLGSRRSRVLFTYNDEVLLIQDTARYFFDDQAWTVPGGGIKRSEEPSTAAAREIDEELGLVIDPDKLELLAVQPSGGHGLRYQGYFFRYRLDERIPAGHSSHEVKDSAWFTPATAAQTDLKIEAQQALVLLAHTN